MDTLNNSNSKYTKTAYNETYKRISNYIIRTPLIRAYSVEQYYKLSFPVYLKAEFLQITKSFKARGAFNALLSLIDLEKKRGVISRSSGNFAQALAYAASILGIKATIVMPENAPEVKKQLTQKYNPRILFAGTTSREGDELVEKISKEENLIKLSPYNDTSVIQGGATVALEVVEDLPKIKNFLCPIGGGGLIGGCSSYLKQFSSGIKTIATEPSGGDDFYRTFAKYKSTSKDRSKETQADTPDEIFTNETINTIADGLRTTSVGDKNWPLLKMNVDDVVTVEDQEIKTVLKIIFHEHNLVIEPSAAVSIAALKYLGQNLEGETVCVVSGGNVDLESFLTWV